MMFYANYISNCKFIAHYICIMFKVVSRVNVLCKQVECKLCSHEYVIICNVEHVHRSKT